MAELVAGIGAAMAYVSSLSSVGASLGATAASVGGTVGAGTAGGGLVAGGAAAAIPTAAAVAAPVAGGGLMGSMAKGLIASSVGSAVTEGMGVLNKPKTPDIPKMPEPKYVPPAEKIAAPSAPPTEGVATSNAFKAEERRRLLAGLPQQTQSVFTSAAGAPGKAKVNKPKLLGGGVGQMTAGV